MREDVAGGCFVGDEDFAVEKDGREAVIVARGIVELHVPEECGGVMQEAIVEGVLGDGLWEVGPIAEGRDVSFFVGEFAEERAVADPHGGAVDGAAHDTVNGFEQGG
jgi:hypothetical protein